MSRWGCTHAQKIRKKVKTVAFSFLVCNASLCLWFISRAIGEQPDRQRPLVSFKVTCTERHVAKTDHDMSGGGPVVQRLPLKLALNAVALVSEARKAVIAGVFFSFLLVLYDFATAPVVDTALLVVYELVIGDPRAFQVVVVALVREARDFVQRRPTVCAYCHL